MTHGYNVAIVGATGAVGEVLIELLTSREFPVRRLYPLASARSAGATVLFGQKPVLVEDVAAFDFSQVDLAFFSAGATVSQQYVPIAQAAGCTVIDNTSCFRYNPEVPLVIPEVNGQLLGEVEMGDVIANPNCSTIQMLVALKPIYDVAGIQRINVATYQAVSGAGNRAIEELARQTADLLNGRSPEADVFEKQIAFNVLPMIDALQDNGYTREEMKMVWETKKILADEQIEVNPTAVRVPVFYGHSEAVHVETLRPISADEVKVLLMQAPGVMLMEDDYPTPITSAANHDAVYVGRVRQDISHPSGVNLWVVSDNIRKGAALNAIQIAEQLFSRQDTKIH